MTLEQFKNTSPLPGQLSMLKDAFDDVKAITIHRTDCSLTAYDSSLNQLTGLTIGIGDGITVTVNDVVKYGSYYFLEINNFTFSETTNPDLCVDIQLTPFDENISIDFRNSVFNPTYNNVPENLTAAAQQQLYAGKLEMRRGKNIYDVDRKNDAIVPTNITNILEGTANLAEFPESNYSSFANTTGRYLGSKTSVLDFGVEPIVGAIYFEGSIYPKDKTNTSICSQSFDQRVIEPLLFAPNVKIAGSSNTEYPEVRVQFIMNKTFADETFGTTDTVINVYQNVNTEPGDIIRVLNGTELMKVTNVTKAGSPISSSIEVERGYYSAYITDSPSNWTAGVTPLNLVKVEGDTIYSPESARPYKVTGKKLWVQETEEVLVIDSRGTVISRELTCN